MASWRSYYRRRYKRYYKNKYRNSYGKRSYGQFKAAKQQADQASQVLNIPTQASCFSKVENLSTGTRTIEQHETGTFALNIYDLLRKSEFYQSYANMYDEFKIDNIKVKLIPTKYNVTVGDGEAGYQSFTVYTAWDRTGLNAKQLFLSVNNTDDNGWIGETANSSSGLYCTVGSDITTYSSAESRQISIGQNSTIVRWLKPKTMQEKSQWISTSQLKAWSYYYNEAKGCYQQIPISSKYSRDGAGALDIISTLSQNHGSLTFALNDISPAISNNPCFLEEDPTINFKPTLLIGIYPVENNQERPRTVSFNIEAEVSCSFRGLRKSKVVSSSSSTPTPTPSANIQSLNESIRAFDEPLIINNTNKPNGVDGYFPINVDTNFRFNPVVVSENNKTYILSKYVQAVGPLNPTPYPYYQVEAKDQPAVNDIVLFQTTIKPEIPTANAVQIGTDGNATTTIDLADFTAVTEETELKIMPGECLIAFSVSDNSSTIKYVFNQNDSDVVDGHTEVIAAPDPNSDVTKYYKEIQVGGNLTDVPVGIRFINKDDNNKLIFTIKDDDSGDVDGFGILNAIIPPSVINFDFSAMDVEPTQSINTKKQFKTN